MGSKRMISIIMISLIIILLISNIITAYFLLNRSEEESSYTLTIEMYYDSRNPELDPNDTIQADIFDIHVNGVQTIVLPVEDSDENHGSLVLIPIILKQKKNNVTVKLRIADIEENIEFTIEKDGYLYVEFDDEVLSLDFSYEYEPKLIL